MRPYNDVVSVSQAYHVNGHRVAVFDHVFHIGELVVVLDVPLLDDDFPSSLN